MIHHLGLFEPALLSAQEWGRHAVGGSSGMMLEVFVIITDPVSFQIHWLQAGIVLETDWLHETLTHVDGAHLRWVVEAP